MKIAVVYGTRPEAIKLAPLILALRSRPSTFDTVVVVTAQHRRLLDQVHLFFRISPDYDLNLMHPGQTLFDLSIDGLAGLRDVLSTVDPDLVVVQGDTSTAFIAALASAYLEIPLVHVEAGMRTHCRLSPFPEEINRQLIARLATLHFAPSENARRNLLNEGIRDACIAVTGNTGVDALLTVCERLQDPTVAAAVNRQLLRMLPNVRMDGRAAPLILVTGHRRENLGSGVENLCRALRRVVRSRADVTIVYCLHPNPGACEPVQAMLGNIHRVNMVDALDMAAFIALMKQADVILTDSGGVQEEALYLGKPLLILREATERVEALDAGLARLVGVDEDRIVNAILAELDRPAAERPRDRNVLPYGDGHAADRIARYLQDWFDQEKAFSRRGDRQTGDPKKCRP